MGGGLCPGGEVALQGCGRPGNLRLGLCTCTGPQDPQVAGGFQPGLRGSCQLQKLQSVRLILWPRQTADGVCVHEQNMPPDRNGWIWLGFLVLCLPGAHQASPWGCLIVLMLAKVLLFLSLSRAGGT